jgi:hypothetical protein
MSRLTDGKRSQLVLNWRLRISTPLRRPRIRRRRRIGQLQPIRSELGRLGRVRLLIRWPIGLLRPAQWYSVYENSYRGYLVE